MKLTDHELESLYRERTARADAATCPSAETMAAAAAGELAPDERERVAAHIARCSTCAEEYRLLGELRDTIHDAAGAGRWPAWHALAAAAVLVLAATIALVAWQTSRVGAPPNPTVRSGQSETLPTSPANDARLTAPPETLSWAATAPGDRYRVTLYDFESTPVWESPTVESPSVALPADVRDRLSRGKPVYWRVAVTSGVSRRDLGPFQFTIAE